MAGNGPRREVTMAEVAKLAGVSVTTVSHVINQTRPVAAMTERAVLAAVAESGYVPDDVVRSMRTVGSRTIGLAISAISNGYFAEVVRSAERVLSRAGYSLLLADTHDEEVQELRAITELLTRRVDAILLAPSAHPARVLEHARRQSVPVVVVDRAADGTLDQVVTENIDSTAELVAHLIGAGHRRIGMISGKAGLSTTEERIVGFKRGLRDAGIRVRNSMIVCGDSTVAGGRLAALDLLDLANPPTAVVVANNAMTIGSIQATHELGMTIPDDLALVAFDDFEWADLFHPRLTVMAQPLQQMGEHAARMVLNRLANPESPVQKTVMRPQFRCRDSCGCAASAHRMRAVDAGLTSA